MAFHVPTAAAARRGHPQLMQQAVLPAPTNGMDGRLNLASNDPSYCIYAYNLVASDSGMRTRRGYRDYQVDIETAPGLGLGVRTVIPSHAQQPHPAQDKLFAVTNEGIWDVTDDGGTPSLVQAFTTTTGNAGWANYAHYTTDAGEPRLFVADEVNGLYVHDPILNSWGRPAITGVDPADIVFVVPHKQRIWLVERDTTTAWYLPVGAVAGAATPFYFGAKFRHGGDLVGLYNWTLDSGEGVDDILVAVSRAGDVIPWKGADPSAAYSWDNIGTFFIGDIPQGRRIGGEYGGELHLLSQFGLVSMADLLSGNDVIAEGSAISQKVGRFLRNDMLRYIDDYGWEVRFNTSEAVMMIGTPVRQNGVYLQYRMHLAIQSWAWWRGVPMLTGETWHGAHMFGTVDNRVCRMDVDLDAVTDANPEGTEIEFSLLTNFVNLNQPAQFKWGEYIRPNWLSLQAPAFEAQFLYDYINVEITAPGAPPDAPQPAWDTDLWDVAIWGSSQLVAFWELKGSWGYGRTLAVAIRGTCRERTTLVSTDIMWRAGGPF